ncbi:imm11 family protein [Fluviispira multicolorata]|uniref:Immunity MXAN-0049 protein domain-containing protein n=1 Tax=Fluviispira multicolorata TaxID=2654512 RepID=A0A833JCN0_9BACT|nr:DUF1629 domain-containing protein [Fluviispira multicolorata]KAB8027418.1 hypothetical protein GCL57_14575 [Fluviispira multicolorata]
MNLFKLTWPKAKNKFLLFYEAPEIDTGLAYDGQLFVCGKRIEINNPLVIDKKSWGEYFADFNFGIGKASYINERFIDCLKAVGETNYQLLPVTVLPEEKPYYILNTLNMIDCVDREQSVFNLWTEEDNRPDILGDFRGFGKMILDPKKVPEGVHFFRIKGWEVVTVVTKALVEEFKKRKITGFELISVG